jgi:hypothetical protein
VKIQEYGRKTYDSRFYSAATALNRYMKSTYFDETWSGKQGGRKAIANARRMSRMLYEQYLARVEPPVPDPARTVSTTLLVNSDSRDEEWPAATAIFGNRTTSAEQDLIQKRKLREIELERFVNDNPYTTTTTTNACCISTSTRDLL